MYRLSGRWDYPLVLSNVHADCNFTSCGTPLVLLQCIAVNLNQDYKLNKLCVFCCHSIFSKWMSCILSRFRSRPSNPSCTNVQCVDCWGVASSPCSATWCMDQFLFLHPFPAHRYTPLYSAHRCRRYTPLWSRLDDAMVSFYGNIDVRVMVGESYLAAVWVILPSPFEPFWGMAIRITLIKAWWCIDLINGVFGN